MEYWTAGLPTTGFQVDEAEDAGTQFLIAPNDWFLDKLANFTCTLPSGVLCPPGHVSSDDGLLCLPASSCPTGRFAVQCKCVPGCAEGHQCKLNMVVPCPLPERCLANNSCSGGFSGDFCLACSDGRYLDDSVCTPCPALQSQFLSTAIFGSLTAILMLYSTRRFLTKKVFRLITARARLLLAIMRLRPGRWPVTFAWVAGLPCLVFFKLNTGDAACLPPHILNNATFVSDFLPSAIWLLCCWTVLLAQWVYSLPLPLPSPMPQAGGGAGAGAGTICIQPSKGQVEREVEQFPVQPAGEVFVVNPMKPQKVIEDNACADTTTCRVPPPLPATATTTAAGVDARVGAGTTGVATPSSAVQRACAALEAACKQATPWAYYIYSSFAAGLLAKVSDSFAGPWTSSLRVSLLYVNATGQAFRSASTDHSFYHAFVPGTLPAEPSGSLLQPRAVVERVALGNGTYLLVPNGVESGKYNLEGLRDRTYLQYVRVLLIVVAASFALMEVLPCFFYCRLWRRCPLVRESPTVRWARCQRVCEAGLGAIVIVGTAAATRLVDTVGLSKTDQQWATGLYFSALVILLAYHGAMNAAHLYLHLPPSHQCAGIGRACHRLCGHPSEDAEEGGSEECVGPKKAPPPSSPRPGTEPIDLCDSKQVSLLGACTDISLYILAGIYASFTYEGEQTSLSRRLAFGMLLTSVTLLPWVLIGHVVVGRKTMGRRAFAGWAGLVAALCAASAVATAVLS